MVSFSGNMTGKVVMVGMKRGDLLLEGIEQALKEHNVKNAVLVSAIGTLQKTVFHRVMTLEDNATEEFVTLTTPIELSALQGGVVDGHMHFHMVMSDPEHSYTGHLEPGCEVLYLAEVVLMEVEDMGLERRRNEFGIALLQKKQAE